MVEASSKAGEGGLDLRNVLRDDNPRLVLAEFSDNSIVRREAVLPFLRHKNTGHVPLLAYHRAGI